MKPSFKKSFLFILTVMALMISAVGVTPAFADEATPPPPTEEPALPPTEEPVVTTDPAATPTEEATTIEQVVDQLPADTTVVVLDASGEALPLVTEDAASVFVSGDPVWCPEDVTPGNDPDDQCTPGQSSFNDLIDLLEADSTYSGAGTIYIAWDYNANDETSPDYGADIVFDYGQLALTDLTFQGGWVFDGNYLGDYSDLTGINSLNFYDWGYDSSASLTINDISINGPAWSDWAPQGTGLYVGSADGNVALYNVSVTNSYEGGAYIDAQGDVDITNSQFDSNGDVESSSGSYRDDSWGYDYSYSDEYGDGSGLSVRTNGSVTLNNVSASENYQDGAYIETQGDIDIANSQFDSNGWVDSYSDSYIYDAGDEYYYSSEYGSGNGLYVRTNGNVTLNNVSANENYEDGARIDGGGMFFFMRGEPTLTQGNTEIANSQFNSNGWVSNYSYSYIYANGDDYFYSGEDGSGNGLSVNRNGNVTLNNITANENYRDGAGIFTQGILDITNSQFNFNGSDWQYYENNYGEESSDEGTSGVGLSLFSGSDATVTCSSFENNAEYGMAGMFGTLTLNGVTFSDNGLGDYQFGGEKDTTVTPVVNSVDCNPKASGSLAEQSDEKSQDALYLIIPQKQEQLPAALGEGNTFGSALKLVFTGSPENTPDGLVITLSFPIPESMKDAKLAVMFWDGSAWVPVSGGTVVDGFFVITVTTPGTYVLVSQ